MARLRIRAGICFLHGSWSVHSVTQWILFIATLAVYDCAPVSYALDILGYMRVHGMSLWLVPCRIHSAQRHCWKYSVSFLPFIVGESSPLVFLNDVIY